MHILIIDDHSFVRKGLLHVLQQDLHPEQVTADEAADFDDAVALLPKDAKYDLVLLDISLGGRSGLELLRIIRHHHPTLPVLIVSMYPEDQYAVRTIKMGASGYLPKHSAPDDLTNAVSQIRKHGSYISPSVARLLANEVSTPQRAALESPHLLLSNRELEIATLIASGCPMPQIADRLNLSIKTVNTHRTRLFKKLKLANNAELAAYFVRNGLLQ